MKILLTIALSVAMLTGCQVPPSQNPLHAKKLLPQRGLAKQVVIVPAQQHPSLQAFFSYAEAVKTAQDYELLAKQFHPATDFETIQQSKGWRRYAYTAAMLGLKNGLCEQIDWKLITQKKTQNKKPLPNQLHPTILGDSLETMRFRLFMRKINNNWMLGRSGLAFTQTFGEPELNTEIAELGLRFKHNLPPAP